MGIQFESVPRQSLSDEIAEKITGMIRTVGFKPSDRLPSISQMARQFGVGAPTVREALKRLETIGVVDIRHGSGVYVGTTPDSFLISNPVFDGTPSKKVLVDLIDSRIPVEMRTAALAATNAMPEHLTEMHRLLNRAGESLDDGELLNQVNLSFHRQIALASGNTVMHQILEVLSSLFRREQRVILDIHGHRGEDHAEHVAVFEAVQLRDPLLAQARMQDHLERVREVLMRWDETTGTGK